MTFLLKRFAEADLRRHYEILGGGELDRLRELLKDTVEPTADARARVPDQ